MTGTSEALRLAELLCARLCHDLSGPLGALIGVLEVARDEQPDSEALALAEETAVQLAQRLKLLRAAWGRDGDDLDVARLRGFADSLSSSRRVRLDLEGLESDALFPPEAARVVLNLLLLASESLAGGGIVALSGSPADSILVTISGPRAAWPAGLGAWLVDEAAAVAGGDGRCPQSAGTADHLAGARPRLPAVHADARRTDERGRILAAIAAVAFPDDSRRSHLPILRQLLTRWRSARALTGPERAAMDDLIADFLTETSESIADLDVALVKLERTPDDQDTLSLIFRLVHTIKGTCGFLGLPRLEHVAHAAENVLGKVRDGVLTATPDTVTLVLAALDRIKAILGGLAATGSELAGDDGELIAALNAAAAGEAPKPPAPVVAAEPEPERSRRTALEQPVAPVAEAAPAPVSPRALVPSEPPPGEPVATNQTIRVTVDVLEDLMTLVSELVLTRNQLLQLARTQESTGFAVPLQRLSHITSDLQEGVMKTRMQPIGNAWNKLPRLVRDLSREMDKKIELTMLGADTELDRQVLELIKDPLTHMVRNSGDHGLESGAERRAAGKPEAGHITLNAYHEGGHIIIEIADDGRGLPLDKIRAKVLKNALATEAELAGMSDVQLQRFIFRAGFSTATVVTAVSGRGVGMDVVKTNIEKIGGTIDLKSVAGAGTTFTIKIPLTLAIVSALIVEAGGERFAIPQISVVELVRARKEVGRGHNEARIGIGYRADQRHAGAAAARPAAAAGQPQRPAGAGTNRTTMTAAPTSLWPRWAPTALASSSTACSTPRKSW